MTGIKYKRAFKVIKENLIFGIREPDHQPELEPEGIVHDKKYAEVWVQYENGTSMLIEMQKNYVMRERGEGDENLRTEMEESESQRPD